MGEVIVTPESYRTSTVTPILLSRTERTETTFEIKQVDNLNNLKKNLKGTLVIKRRTNAGPKFEEPEKFSRKSIRSNEMVEILFDTDETYKLGKGLFDYYKLLGGKTTNPYEETKYIEKDERIEAIRRLLESREGLYEAIEKIDLSALNIAVNIENLRRAKEQMSQNMDNDGETEFWQEFFSQNAWILAQLFHAPVMFYKGRRYVGGKGIDNCGGQYTDFIYKNDVTDNIAIIEIKSPVKPLLGREYRQTFTVSDELSGGINQLLLQKQTLYRSYTNLLAESEERFEANNIECILVIGNVGALDTDRKRVFDTYRNEMRSIRVVGFDELLMRIENQLDLLEQQ